MKQSLSSKNGKPMGMFSEFNAELQAKAYEKMIMDYIAGKYEGSSAVKDFIQDHIVVRYYSECADSYGLIKINPIILKEFPIVEKVAPSIIDFYTGTGVDHLGRTFESILMKSNAEFEKCHDFIQWLFPLHEKSRMTNALVPVISIEESKILSENSESVERMNRAVYRFKRFLIETGSDNWGTHMNHNLLRITRILRSMRLFGLEDEAMAFYKEVIYMIRDVDANTLLYWDRALTAYIFNTLY